MVRLLRFLVALVMALMLARAAEAIPKTHVIRKGDTLGSLSARYGTTVAELRRLNGLRKGQILRAGSTLRLTPPSEYVVQAGDSLGKIAKKSGTTADALRKLNGLKPGARLRVGTKLRLNPNIPRPSAPSVGRAPRVSPRGTVTLIRGAETFKIPLATRKGGLSTAGLTKLSKALRHRGNGASHPVHPQLARLLLSVSQHFGGRRIHVISGFRPYSPTQYTPHSNHNVGRAIDFSVEGVSNRALVAYCRTLRGAGVGYYPNSTFVHLDTRKRSAYWIDHSGPGEAPRYVRGGSRPKRPISPTPPTSIVNAGGESEERENVDEVMRETATDSPPVTTPGIQESEPADDTPLAPSPPPL